MKKLLLIIAMLFICSFSVFAADKTYTVSWDLSSETDLDHYVIHLGEASRQYTNSIKTDGLVNSYIFTVDDTKVWYVAVTAVDKSGLESDYSNEVNTYRPEAPTIKLIVTVEITTERR